ncbi:Major_facilitator superfamily protein [Hexamita inflata]|uniref:Major facilitator superfamily protein n=1 Tax=Hexamita inflata TaxID=28002 RepID=A0AA86R940_9EUKA|nr:Major facilitator superfamily protein [Hexamita inflata]
MSDSEKEQLIEEKHIEDQPVTIEQIQQEKDISVKFVYLLPFLLVAYTSSLLDTTGNNLSLPYIQQDFNKSQPVAQWVQSIYYLSQASLSIPLAKLGEILGQKHSIMWFCGLHSIVTVSMFFTSNFILYCSLRFIQGALASGAMASRTTIVRKLSPKSKAQQYIQYNMATLSFVSIIIPSLCGLIIDVNWRYILIFNASSSLLSVFLIIPFVNTKSEQRQRIDIYGSIFLFIAIACIDLSFTFIGEAKYILFGCLLPAGLLFIVFFVFSQRNNPNALVPLHLMKQPVSDYVLVNFTQYFASSGFNYLIPQAFKHYNLNSTTVGLIQTINAVGSLIVSVSIPSLTKIFLNKHIIQFGYLINIILLIFALIFANAFISTVIIYVLFSIALTIINQTVYPLILLSVPVKFAAQIGAIPTVSRTIGSALTVSICSSILGAEVSKGQNGFVVKEQIIICLFLVFVIVGFGIIGLRTGQGDADRGKRGFQERKVIQLKVE